MRGRELQADGEHQKRDPELGDLFEAFMVVQRDPEHRADGDPGKDIADDRRDIEAPQHDVEHRRDRDREDE